MNNPPFICSLFLTGFFLSDPPIPHIVHIEELRSIIPRAPLDMSTEKECFDLWIQVMQIQPYRKPVITGLISSIGSLTESLVFFYKPIIGRNPR